MIQFASAPSCLLTLAFSILTATACAQELAEKETPADSAEAMRHRRMRDFAASHEVVPFGDDMKADFIERPIIRWSNPTRRGSIGGATYMWVQQGRPVATIGLWTYKDTKDSYEYQSLCQQRLTARRDGDTVWSTSTPGVEFRSLANAPSPATTATKRLTQMRQLARQRFSSSIGSGENQEKLRLLPQPIYRYAKQPPNVIDGAAFSFATGTDPESLLLLEAREEDNRWYYAFGSQTSGFVTGSLDGEEVWSNKDKGDTYQLHVFYDE